MPIIRYYTVTQTREVQIVANSPIDAIKLAGIAFDGGQDPNTGRLRHDDQTWGDTRGLIRTTNMNVTED